MARNPRPPMPKEKQKSTRVFSNIFWILGQGLRFSPKFIVAYLFDGCLMAALGVLDAWYTKRLFDMLDGGAPTADILKMIAAVSGLSLLLLLENNVFWHCVSEREQLKIKCGLQLRLFDHAVSLDIGKYELPSFYNDFILSIEVADSKMTAVLQVFRRLIKNVSSGIAVFGIIFSLDPFVALFIVAMTACGTVCQRYINRVTYDYRMDCRRANRIFSYVSRVHYMPDYAKELRVGNGYTVLNKLYDEGVCEHNEYIKKYTTKIERCNLIWKTVGTFKDYAVMLILIYKMLVEKSVLLGGFALCVSSAWRVAAALRTAVSAFADLANHSLYIEKLRTFFSTESAIADGELVPSDFESLEFKNVSFAYENGIKVMDNVSFSIKKGKKIAIVGYNGAGKTTLIKLLMRYYDVLEGEILYNGVNIKNYNLKEYRKRISAVFQDFKIFAATVAENVAAGGFSEGDTDKILTALEDANFKGKLTKLEDGINTNLTREFLDDGVNLSGGESQKLAIARAFYADADITVMDEPSSALDPVAEYELNNHIRNALSHKTVIFISHRLSTTRDADEIVMFEKGRIIEHGSHDELIAKNGAYAALFNLQAEKYRAGDSIGKK